MRGAPPSVRAFRKTIWDHYHAHARPMPWRETENPYHIFVSEVMLQQTQVSRVLEKYLAFIKKFPSFRSLAKASPASVLAVWQGLGYNRRALYLKKAAEMIVKNHHGALPEDPELLLLLPGIGPGTAGSIAAFAYNKPVVFIETNIRRVYIHFFFSQRRSVKDESILPRIAETLDTKNPREWYWALMDYGAMLAREVKNPNRRSAHYTKQSRFEGSLRETRGALIKILLQHPSETERSLTKQSGHDKERVVKALAALVREGTIIRESSRYRLA